MGFEESLEEFREEVWEARERCRKCELFRKCLTNKYCGFASYFIVSKVPARDCIEKGNCDVARECKRRKCPIFEENSKKICGR